MKANHNESFVVERLAVDVFQWTKIQFWKQITTNRLLWKDWQSMYFNELRYNFESKSQRYSWCKHLYWDVFQWTKIQFWKQITTQQEQFTELFKMYFNELRYNFESKSQRLAHSGIESSDVFQWTKIQFWKQITTKYLWILLLIRCISMN